MNKRPVCLVSLFYILGILSTEKNLIWIMPAIAGIVLLCFFYGKSIRELSFILIITFILGMSLTKACALKRDNCLSYVRDKEDIAVSGKIYKKEIKDDKLIYYLKNKDFRAILYTEADVDNIVTDEKKRALGVDEIPIGSYVTAKGSLGFMREKRNEGNFDEEAYYYSRGIYFKIFDASVTVKKRPLFSLREFLFILLVKMQDVIEGILPGEESGILCAICLGSKAGLSDDVKDLFRDTGLSHILAVSGLHVSVVGMGIYSLLRKRSLSFALAGSISAAVLLCYGIMCGNTVSTVRAVGMFIIYMISQIMGEAYDAPSALSFMGMILLLINPMYLFYTGFLLSFLTVFGILFVAKPLSDLYLDYKRLVWERTHKKDVGRRYRPSLFDSIKTSFVFSFGIQLFSLPILLLNFYGVSPYVIFLNLIVLPFVGVLLFAGLMGGLFGAFISLLVGALPIGLFHALKFIPKLILYPCHLILYFYEFLMTNALKLPYAKIFFGAPKPVVCVIYYILLFALTYIILWRGNRLSVKAAIREDKTGRSDFYLSRKGKKDALILVTMLCLLPLLVIIHLPDKFSVTMLDVGQGDCLMISDGHGRHYMIDGGSTDVKEAGRYRVLPYLKYHGINRIDCWFVTHCDLDHISGLSELLEEDYHIGKICFAKCVEKNENYEKLTALATEKGVPLSFIKTGDRIGREECFFTVLYPGSEPVFSGANENSLVLHLKAGCFDAVFTGDIGAEQERYIIDEKKIDKSTVNAELGFIGNTNEIELLKSSHHGSAGSNDMEWLKTLSPELCIISAGVNNRYGHPSPETLERMDKSEALHLCTADCGQITVKLKKEKMLVDYYLH